MLSDRGSIMEGKNTYIEMSESYRCKNDKCSVGVECE